MVNVSKFWKEFWYTKIVSFAKLLQDLIRSNFLQPKKEFATSKKISLNTLHHIKVVVNTYDVVIASKYDNVMFPTELFVLIFYFFRQYFWQDMVIITSWNTPDIKYNDINTHFHIGDQDLRADRKSVVSPD